MASRTELFGQWLQGSLVISDIGQSVGGRWFVNPDSTTGGTTSGFGASPDAPFTTVAAAVAAASAGDTIYLAPSTAYSEVVTCSKANVRFIGLGTNPAAVTWTSAVDTATLTLAAAGILVQNIKFAPPAYSASTTYGPCAILLSGANYATIRGCRFQGKTGSYYAIYSPVCNSDNVTIEDNEFIYMNTATSGAAILGVEAGGLSYSAWNILRNKFNSCVTAININGRVCTLECNHFGVNGINAAGAGAAVCTLAIDLSGTSSYANKVHGNYLGGAYTNSLYKVGATGDDWAGNFNIAGITAANP
jgi:hypothetical protein